MEPTDRSTDAGSSIRRAQFEPEPFGKYFLLDRIAVGGMAEIFRARTYGEGGFEKELVIKRILSHLNENEEFVQMFIEEAKLTVLLQHPAIVQVYDFGKIRDHYYLAMEGPYGRDLKTIMTQLWEERQLPLEFGALIAHEIARGLAYAHGKRDEMGSPLEIVHRDVSPSNVFVSWDGQVKLLDFGIAKASKSTFENTEEGVLKGKFEYMSPEQAQGKIVDHRSDVFSAGICLWEMATGKRLFKSDTPILTLTRIRAGEVPLVRQENPDVPKPLADIIHRALAYHPGDRYQSADEMRRDLEHFLQPSTTHEASSRLAEWMHNLFAVELELEQSRLEQARKAAGVLAAMEDTLELDLILDEEEEETIDDKVEIGPTDVSDHPEPPPPLRKSRSVLWIALAAVAAVLIGGVTAALVLPALLAPTPEQVLPGSLDVEIVPPEAADAQVFLDGAPIQVPFEGLEPGVDHSLAVIKEGFQTHEESFSVQPGGRHQAHAKMRPVGDGTVEEPVTGEEPATATEPATGEEPATATEPATPEPPTPDPTPAEERPPAIVWQSSPSGAWVVIDGNTRGRAPYRQEDAAPGETVQAKFKLDGYADARASGVVPTAGSTTVRASLKRLPEPKESAYLTVNATPWADVYVDGTHVGQTPIGNLEVEAGTHTIRLVCPPLEAEVTRTVTLAPGEKKPVSADLEE